MIKDYKAIEFYVKNMIPGQKDISLNYLIDTEGLMIFFNAIASENKISAKKEEILKIINSIERLYAKDTTFNIDKLGICVDTRNWTRIDSKDPDLYEFHK